MSRVFFALGTALRETGQALDRVGCSMQGSSAFREIISKHRAVRSVYEKTPALPKQGFIAPSASVVGDVKIGERSSVWYGAVLRGDVNSISVGSQTNIQDNAVVHVAKTNVGGKSLPTVIGDRVTVGHNAVLHACVIEDDAFIGMGATVMDGAVVEKGAMVAAGALVTPGVVVPSGQLWAGAPARFMRDMTADEKAFTVTSAATYAEVADVHAAECGKSHLEIEHDRAAREMARERDADYDSHMGISRDQVKVQV
jgi:carbonic anhydrase/acetyltransferase-like protein (isoleucine patch superfamily)